MFSRIGPGEWTWLEIVKVALGSLTPIAILLLTLSADRLVRNSESLAAKQDGIEALSQDIYARRARSELLASGLRRHAASPTDGSLEEVSQRKRAYDEEYVNWNKRNQSNLLSIRRFLNAEDYSALEQTVEVRLVGSGFALIDDCLTKAYDAAVRDGDPRPMLDDCRIRELLQYTLDCGYAITNELFQALSNEVERPEVAVFESGEIQENC